MPQPQFAALDSRFLADLEIGYPQAQGKFDDLSKRYYFLVTSTTLQDLADAQLHSDDHLTREVCKGVLQDYKLWGVLDMSLRPEYNGVAEVIANALITAGVVPDGHINGALIVAEAALHNCRVLVTHRRCLHDADKQGLARILFEHDVVCPLIEIFQ